MNNADLTATETDRRKVWVEPVIRMLEIDETNQFPNLGADVGGNPSPDCQRS